MNVYAESSAVPAWLLGEATAPAVKRILLNADVVFASDLTLVECDRPLIRAVALGALREADAERRRARLTAAAAAWQLLRVSREVVDRARQPFPGEPVRSLDALASRFSPRSSGADA